MKNSTIKPKKILSIVDQTMITHSFVKVSHTFINVRGRSVGEITGNLREFTNNEQEGVKNPRGCSDFCHSS